MSSTRYARWCRPGPRRVRKRCTGEPDRPRSQRSQQLELGSAGRVGRTGQHRLGHALLGVVLPVLDHAGRAPRCGRRRPPRDRRRRARRGRWPADREPRPVRRRRAAVGRLTSAILSQTGRRARWRGGGVELRLWDQCISAGRVPRSASCWAAFDDLSATDLGGYAIAAALERSGVTRATGRLRGHGPGAAGRRRSDPGPPGRGQGRDRDVGAGPHHQQGVPVRAERGRAGRPADPGGRVRHRGGRRDGVDDPGPAPAAGVAVRLQVRQRRRCWTTWPTTGSGTSSPIRRWAR